MTPKLVARIANEVPAVACIKLESLPTTGRIAALRALWASELPTGGAAASACGRVPTCGRVVTTLCAPEVPRVVCACVMKLD